MDIEEKTPFIINILGWFLIVGGMLFIIKIVIWGSDFSYTRGIWNGFMKFFSVVAGIGFLRLKKWAIFLYFGGFFLSSLVFYFFPPSDQVFELYSRPLPVIMLIIIPTVVGTIVLKHKNRFN